jgi:hypothetical protein
MCTNGKALELIKYEDVLSVECLVPLRAVVHPYLYSQEYVVPVW